MVSFFSQMTSESVGAFSDLFFLTLAWACLHRVWTVLAPWMDCSHLLFCSLIILLWFPSFFNYFHLCLPYFQYVLNCLVVLKASRANTVLPYIWSLFRRLRDWGFVVSLSRFARSWWWRSSEPLNPEASTRFSHFTQNSHCFIICSWFLRSLFQHFHLFTPNFEMFLPCPLYNDFFICLGGI